MQTIWIVVIVLGGLGFFSLIVGFKFYEINKRKLKTRNGNFYLDNINSFIEAKENFNILIETNIKEKKYKSWNQIENTKYVHGLENTSGIYAILIDGCEFNEIIPIYVGQAKNIFKRWEQHQREIKKVILENSQIRTYKKIVNFLNIKELNIENIKFVVLEKTDVESLNEREKHYISVFQSDINGFNGTKGNNY